MVVASIRAEFSLKSLSFFPRPALFTDFVLSRVGGGRLDSEYSID